jgi:hypothetical protein
MVDLREFVERNSSDLQALGLLFSRLLQADMCVMDSKPSPVLAAVMGLEDGGLLQMTQTLTDLLKELGETDVEPLTDGFGGSILRL